MLIVQQGLAAGADLHQKQWCSSDGDNTDDNILRSQYSGPTCVCPILRHKHWLHSEAGQHAEAVQQTMHAQHLYLVDPGNPILCGIEVIVVQAEAAADLPAHCLDVKDAGRGGWWRLVWGSPILLRTTEDSECL